MDPTLTAQNVKAIDDGLQELRVRMGPRHLRVYFRVENGVGIGLTAFDKSNGKRAESKARRRAEKRWRQR